MPSQGSSQSLAGYAGLRESELEAHALHSCGVVWDRCIDVLAVMALSLR